MDPLEDRLRQLKPRQLSDDLQQRLRAPMEHPVRSRRRPLEFISAAALTAAAVAAALFLSSPSPKKNPNSSTATTPSPVIDAKPPTTSYLHLRLATANGRLDPSPRATNLRPHGPHHPQLTRVLAMRTILIAIMTTIMALGINAAEIERPALAHNAALKYWAAFSSFLPLAATKAARHFTITIGNSQRPS